MSQRCVCSQLAYRNNNDGKRDYKIIGKSTCRICRGSGYVKRCDKCNGAGIFDSKVCPPCYGNGKVRCEN